MPNLLRQEAVEEEEEDEEEDEEGFLGAVARNKEARRRNKDLELFARELMTRCLLEFFFTSLWEKSSKRMSDATD
ncbi:hypothetical protein EYF80_012746 [Liparis tanakae]|uniref:Uncharacterized protein n=1 Tax=Liparis tanakae TaxID=230148 RepID=A0A4Z2IGY2_9TELE|nr:hypothetical protein EYF80_012746 [Liparis tanakae]